MHLPYNLLASTEKIKINKNSSGDEIANVNFFTTTSYNTSKYNTLLNIQNDAGRGAASGCGLVVLARCFSHSPICCNEVKFLIILPEYHLTTGEFLTLTPSLGAIHCEYRHK